jgi:pimeloyl-ACP methyl ester carboxylesterase
MTTWVLLRGLARESGHWSGFVDCFGQAMPDARVVTIDLPGNGTLHERASPLTIAAMADHCQETLESIGGPSSVYVFAMSLGAMVAVEWARRRPDVVRGCVLVNTSLKPPCPFWERLRPANYARLLRLTWMRDAHAVEAQVLQMTSRRVARAAREADTVVRQWARLRSTRPVRVANVLRQLFAAARYRAPPAAPPGRLLLLASEGDELVDPRCSHRLAARWHCELIAHPDAGHDLPLDAPRWTASTVAQWVARGSVPAAAPGSARP